MRVLALDVGGTAIKSALFDEQGRLLDERETPSGRDIGDIVAPLLAVARSYERYSAIGISMTGQVNGRTGCVVSCMDNEPCQTGTPVAQQLSQRVSLPVFIENDANAAALGEARFGAGRGVPDFLCVTLGTGIGGGLVLGGALYTGANGLAGEIGHMPIHAGGEVCRCGRRGCYEHYAATTALVRKARALNPAYDSGRAVFARLSEDADLRAVVEAWIEEIVYGLVVLTHALNPARIAISGGVAEQPYVLERIRCLLPPQLMVNYRTTEVVPAQLGHCSGLYGAYAIALDGCSERRIKGAVAIAQTQQQPLEQVVHLWAGLPRAVRGTV